MYPTLDKILALRDKTQTVGEFLDWLQQQGYIICKYREDEKVPCFHCEGTGYDPQLNSRGGRSVCGVCGWAFDAKGDGYITEISGYYPAYVSIDSLLHQFFDIDAAQEEKEKMMILEEIRLKNQPLI